MQAEWKSDPELTRKQRLATWIRELHWSTWIVVPLAIALVIYLRTDRILSGTEPLAGVVLLGVLVAIMGARAANAFRPLRPGRALRAFLRTNEAHDKSVVRLSILRGDKLLAVDEGTVNYEGGALAYDGLRTAFRLTPSDVYVDFRDFSNGPLLRRGQNARFGNVDSREAWGFTLATDREVRLFFLPLSYSPQSPFLYTNMFKWLRDKPASNAETILPPTAFD